jgi:hypothetical protein
MALTFNKQLRIHSIIDRLVRLDSETFDLNEARELRDILIGDCGLKPVPGWFVSFSSPFPSQGTSGYAAGLGTVTDNSGERKQIELGRGERLTSGNWSLYLDREGIFNSQQCICIDRRFDETRRIQDRESYHLMLNRNNEPTALKKVTPQVISFVLPSLFGPPRRVDAAHLRSVIIKRPAVTCG